MPLLTIKSDAFDGERYSWFHLEGTMGKRFHVWAKLVMIQAMIQLLARFGLVPEI